MRLQHVSIPIPPDGAERARAFYGGVLEMEELPKPEPIRARGGVWFRAGGQELHVGVEEPFQPARKAHPAFVVDVDTTAAALTAAGHEIRWADPAEIPGRRRFHTNDPNGNRLEFLEG